MTLEEKYAEAVRALREIVKRGQEGSLAGNDYGNDPRFWDGYDRGLESSADDAEACLRRLGEDLKG